MNRGTMRSSRDSPERPSVLRSPWRGYAVQDQQVTGIRESLRMLFTSAAVDSIRLSSQQLRERYPGIPSGAATSGHAIHKERADLWIPLSEGSFAFFSVSRPGLGLSEAERRCLRHFARSAQAVLVNAPSRAVKTAERIASRYSFEHILITRFLRGTTPAGSIWTPALIISELQELSFRRYEGQPCTSGFLFTSEPTKYLAASRIDGLGVGYEYDPFSAPLRLDEGFFKNPATYRYIDGRNAFYVIDNFQKVHGVFRIRVPTQFNRADRVAYRHIAPLVKSPRGRAWAGIVGPNSTVDFVLSDGTLLRWSHFHWHLLDRSMLMTLLFASGLGNEVAGALADLLFTLSDMKLGTLVLVSDEDVAAMRAVGRIDHSLVAEMLAEQFAGRTLVQMMRDGSALGVLSSDGLTALSTSGTITATGLIIDLARTDHPVTAGGGRTQAARAASTMGLVLKVSADGPVSAFRDGKEVLRYEH